MKNKKQYVCTSCGYIGEPKKIIKGNFLTEIVLWLLAILPGVIYTVWRLSTRADVCPKCQNSTMIPVDTPKGRELAEKNK